MSVYERVENKVVAYYGHKDSEVYKIMGLVWLR